MKQTSRIILVVLAIAAILFVRIGHVSAAQISEPEGSHVQKVEVTFTGVIEKMDQNQWVIDGNTIIIDPALAGSFKVGDTVKVEGFLQSDGTVSAKNVELPSGFDDKSNDSNNNSNASNSNDANANSNNNSNDNSVNDNTSVDNSNNSNSNGNTNDNSSVDNNSNSNTNGSVGDNSNQGQADDHGHDSNTNDNHGNDHNSNDSQSHDNNTNEDHGGSGNGNSNDSGSSNSNDDGSNHG
jgi:hypothetical protein